MIAKTEGAERTAPSVKTVVSEAKTNADNALERTTIANNQSAQVLNQANSSTDTVTRASTATKQATLTGQ